MEENFKFVFSKINTEENKMICIHIWGEKQRISYVVKFTFIDQDNRDTFRYKKTQK